MTTVAKDPLYRRRLGRFVREQMDGPQLEWFSALRGMRIEIEEALEQMGLAHLIELAAKSDLTKAASPPTEVPCPNGHHQQWRRRTRNGHLFCLMCSREAVKAGGPPEIPERTGPNFERRERKCLRCGTLFDSPNAGIRTCRSCKGLDRTNRTSRDDTDADMWA